MVSNTIIWGLNISILHHIVNDSFPLQVVHCIFDREMIYFAVEANMKCIAVVYITNNCFVAICLPTNSTVQHTSTDPQMFENSWKLMSHRFQNHSRFVRIIEYIFLLIFNTVQVDRMKTRVPIIQFFHFFGNSSEPFWIIVHHVISNVQFQNKIVSLIINGFTFIYL